MSAPLLRCVKCQAAIPIPAEVTRTGTGSVVCPSCGQRYTRRPAPVLPPTAGPERSPAATPQGPTRPLGAAGAAPPAPVLGAGETIAGRYRILHFLARGGMGEVYEAEDLELRERIALKTIHPAVAAEEGAVERFKREIHLARKVTHPNVCRIFDLGQHAARPGEAPVVFLTMELLEGETLAARLLRAGRMPLEQALPVVRQCAAALDAAHAAGVIHRDFKSENVFLVPASAGERAVVTDFGIARGGADDRFKLTLTSAGGVVGTPAYMAPEQVAGEPVTPAVDQYALGVVLYEMTTGELPFKGDSPLSTAAKRLTEPAPSPLVLVPDLDPRCASVLSRALARKPGDRFPSLAALVRALDGEASPLPSAPAVAEPAASAAPEPAPPAARRERRQRALAALLLVALAGTSVWAYYRVRALREKATAVRPAAARRAVAVLGLRNLSERPDAAWLSTALAEMLATELGQADDLRVVPGESVARAQLDLGIAPSEMLAAAERARLRGRLGADFLVAGAYTALGGGGPLRLDLRLEDARTAETVASIAASGSEAELFRLVAEAGAGLREKLGAGGRGAARPLLPASPEAARLYAEGLDALRGFEPERGRDLLARAVELDPGNALAHSALASAWGTLGFGERAASEARRAFELASGLPEPERLMVEARYYEAAGDWGRAAELWQALWSAAPDSLEHGLASARARTEAGDAESALTVIATLRALPAPESEDPRLDLAEATAAAARAEYPRQAEAAARAAARAEALGARALAAEALVSRAWALRNLGRFDEALAAAERARALARALGDRGGEAAAGTAAAGVLADRGDLDGARAAYEAALAICRERGDKGGAARALNNLAVVLRNRGELAAARRDYEEAEAIAVETGNRRGAAYAATNVAAILADAGELDHARTRLAEALATFRELADPAGAASALASLGGVERRRGDLRAASAALEESLAVRRSIGQRAGEAASLAALGQVLLDGGELDAAERRFDEALALARELAQKSAEASALAGLGELAALRDDPAAAGSRFAEALALRRTIGESAGAERLRVSLARLDAERSPESAVTAAREVLAGLPAEAPVELEAAARLAWARAELARGRPADARRALEPALGGAARLGRASALEARLLAARADAGVGRRSTARAELEAVAGEAAAAGLLALEIESRLAAAGTGDAAALAALAARARDAGLLALAARAGG